MHWIYLSPHLDDAALSCGGLVAEQVADGDKVEIWTICAGDPPAGRLTSFASQLHQRWETGLEAISVRRAEDVAACLVLGAQPRHFTIPDCIYRRDPITAEPLITVNDDLFRPLPPSQADLIVEIQNQLTAYLPPACKVVVPLTLGNHIDHQLVRLAAETLKIPLWFYADYPYAVQDAPQNASKLPRQAQVVSRTISTSNLHTWQAAIAAYRSQISTFWESTEEMKASIRSYLQAGGGCKLWTSRHYFS